MGRKSIICALLLGVGLLATQKTGDACTNIIISKGASADGSSIVSYAADSHWQYGELYFKKAADWKAGSLLQITEWDTYKPLGAIPQVAHTFQTVGNMNEHQLIIAETTFGGRRTHQPGRHNGLRLADLCHPPKGKNSTRSYPDNS